MGVRVIVNKMKKIITINNKKQKHYNNIQKLLNKLEAKEKRIKTKLMKEKDKIKRKKQRHSLSIIRAHRKKAKRILNAS